MAIMPFIKAPRGQAPEAVREKPRERVLGKMVIHLMPNPEPGP